MTLSLYPLLPGIPPEKPQGRKSPRARRAPGPVETARESARESSATRKNGPPTPCPLRGPRQAAGSTKQEDHHG